MTANINPKKYFSISTVILGALFFAVLVSAQYIKSDPSSSAQSTTKLYVPSTNNINKIINEQERIKEVSDLKGRLNQIEDRRKRYEANKIINDIGYHQELWSNHFNNVLEKLGNILVKIESRSAKAELNGKDVAKVNEIIDKAKKSIDIAFSAVAEEESKIYVINVSLLPTDVSSDLGQAKLITTLREQFRILEGQFKEDIFSIRDGVMKEARDNVRNAFLEVADIPDIDSTTQ